MLASVFLQSVHLHAAVHRMSAWKHSQYFLRQPDFLQWQPLLWRPSASVLELATAE